VGESSGRGYDAVGRQPVIVWRMSMSQFIVRRLGLLVGSTASLWALAGAFLPLAASADRTVHNCTIVAHPTREHHTSCAGENLSRANLSGDNLSYADLTHANLAHAHLPDANLYHANLFSANLAHANLSDSDLTGTSLISAKFCHTTMPDGHIKNPGC
jgi:uncharacterized protein YjbI with pentapeptide repeats